MPKDKEKPRTFINSTKAEPDGTLEASVAFVDEFKKIKVDPKTGFNQHLNQKGPTCFDAVDSKDNVGNARNAIASCEVLAQRAAQKGDEHDLDDDCSPESAITMLKAVAEFANKRVKMLLEERVAANVKKTEEHAKALGISLKPAKTTA